ncbi:hypothetical protein TMP227_50065 [Tenacibaculum maritimum]|uniref:hypothetical protein n=1 Tax=Tenacibaculum maritimum TaxID=107401 RepID=UPI0012E65F13|nr:hypothetical protein [Tenacibaculum maritimum]CAA0229321.1 hypothetical protein TMP227_50065 [Tenacibaculum maritimum]
MRKTLLIFLASVIFSCSNNNDDTENLFDNKIYTVKITYQNSSLKHIYDKILITGLPEGGQNNLWIPPNGNITNQGINDKINFTDHFDANNESLHIELNHFQDIIHINAFEDKYKLIKVVEDDTFTNSYFIGDELQINLNNKIDLEDFNQLNNNKTFSFEIELKAK